MLELFIIAWRPVVLSILSDALVVLTDLGHFLNRDFIVKLRIKFVSAGKPVSPVLDMLDGPEVVIIHVVDFLVKLGMRDR